MNPVLMSDCLRRIETRWRGIGLFWNDSVAATLVETIGSWEDGAGERAVNRWIWSTVERMDVAELARLYREESPHAVPAVGMAGEGYERQRAGVKPYDLMMEGVMAYWRTHHPNEPLKPDLEKTVRQIDARRAAESQKARDLASIVADIGMDGEPTDPPGYDPFA